MIGTLRFDQHGFDLHLANKVRKVSPRIRWRNCGRILSDADLRRLGKGGPMARLLGVVDDDPRRRIAAVEAACIGDSTPSIR
jgi:hypothetical protein